MKRPLRRNYSSSRSLLLEDRIETPSPSSGSRRPMTRSLRRMESPIVQKSRSFDDRGPPFSAPTTSASSSSTTTSVSSHDEEDMTIDRWRSVSGMAGSPTSEMKITSVRKRPSPKSPDESDMMTTGVYQLTPMRAMNIFQNTTSPSNNNNHSHHSSQNRRKKSRRKGFYYLLQRKQWRHALWIVLGLLFLSSFCLSFLDVPSFLLSTTRLFWGTPTPSKTWTRLYSPQLRRASEHRSTIVTTRPFFLRRATRTTKELFQQYSLQAPLCTNPLTPDDVDFTVATQLSLNRLWMLEHHCARWPHAISLAVHVGNDTSATVDRITEQVLHMGCRLEQMHILTLSGYSDEEYPVNILRNMALAAVTTSHVVYVDVDFWESIDLYDTLLSHKALLAAHSKLALVVPAFQLSRQCREWRDCRADNIPKMPHVKEELVDLMVARQANAFDPSNRGGHGSTRYKDWLIQEKDELIPIECVKSNRYEPYLVVRKCYDLPPFQEAFTGYGKNKMTWVMQLRRTGYQFMQLGGSFVVHYPHLDSTARMHWNGGKDGSQLPKPKNPSVDLSTYKRGQVDVTFVAFREWLFRSVPDQAVVPMCEDASDDDERLWIAPKEQMRR